MPLRRTPATLAGMLAATVATAVLAGCAQESAAPTPLELSPTASSVTPTESPPGPPPMPDEARGTGRKAAVAFVRHWVDTLNYSADTGSTDQLRGSTASCSACDGIAGFIDDVYGAGGSIESEGWDIDEIWVANESPDFLQVAAQVDSHGQVVMKPGAKRKRYAGGPSLKLFTLEAEGDTWRITKLVQS